MKKRNVLLGLAIAGVAALSLASCDDNAGGSSTISSSEVTTEESQSSAIQFNDVKYYVVVDYNNGKVSKPYAKAATGNYPKITDLTELESLAAINGDASVYVGYSLTLNGKFTITDGKYMVASEEGAQHTGENSATAKLTYNKTENKLVFDADNNQDGKTYFDHFTDASKLKGVIDGENVIAFSALEDGAEILLSAPIDWALEDNFTINYDYVAAYKL